jgi:glycosyltransferase involved in cell wall biosynthesis
MNASAAQKSRPVIGLVVPCFNEEAVLPATARRLLAELETLAADGLIGPGSRLWLVDDGSTDGTWASIVALVDAGAPVSGIKLTRNFGHQYALYAGLMEATGDALISLDADLQDDVGAIRQMLGAFGGGSEIVFGVRDDRSSDSRFKRVTASLHYALFELLGAGTIRHHADFRLMSRRAIELLRQYRETNLYLRGIVPMLGLNSAIVYFRRAERSAGTSKYSLRRMLSLSLTGLTSFSIMPLRLITALGFLVFVVALGLGAWAFWVVTWNPLAVPGWASTVIPVYLLGGVQLLAIGIAGEYIGKAYLEVKRRPHYLVEELRGPPPATREAPGGTPTAARDERA